MAHQRNSTATMRLKQEFKLLKKDPLPYIEASPLPSNLLEWRYVIKGPEDSPFAGGYYQGKVVFPMEYPFKPPSIYMLTANGRFETNVRLCLSMSDYHPETWNPSWSVSTILTGLLSFFLEDSPTVGSISSPSWRKRNLADDSLKHCLDDKVFRELFPELVAEINNRLAKLRQPDAGTSDSDPAASEKSTSNAGDSRTLLGRIQPLPNKPAEAMAKATIGAGAFYNLALVVGFAFVACTLRWIAQD